MKAIFAGLTAVVLIAAVAGVGLPYTGWSSEEVQSNQNVRLD